MIGVVEKIERLAVGHQRTNLMPLHHAVEITGPFAIELKNGFIEGFRGLLTDDSRFAAASAQRTDGNRTEMRRAVYSPCRICEDEPDRPPLWRIIRTEGNVHAIVGIVDRKALITELGIVEVSTIHTVLTILE